ncbi:hypothetical protein GCM10022222_70260 [Amycolatopsis ultiminotia]|uniref:Uncharacterized protein n=1 Tax=Amycolatopsis ultiminotia TaxID=543629 RepID=A0ABP6Y2R0_9PSEU
MPRTTSTTTSRRSPDAWPRCPTYRNRCPPAQPKPAWYNEIDARSNRHTSPAGGRSVTGIVLSFPRPGPLPPDAV